MQGNNGPTDNDEEELIRMAEEIMADEQKADEATKRHFEGDAAPADVEVIQPGELYGVGRVRVQGSQRLRGLPVTLSALDPYGSDFVAVIGGPDCQALFPRVPEGEYFCQAFVNFSQISVWSGEEALLDWSEQRQERRATSYR